MFLLIHFAQRHLPEGAVSLRIKPGYTACGMVSIARATAFVLVKSSH